MKIPLLRILQLRLKVPLLRAMNLRSSSEIAEASATVLKFPYNQRVEQGLIRELSAFIGEKSLSNSSDLTNELL